MVLFYHNCKGYLKKHIYPVGAYQTVNPYRE
jgi:hypothetical protein